MSRHLVLVALVLVASCNYKNSSTSQTTLGETKLMSSDQILASMQSKANPYSGSYKEWDEWLVNNYYKSSLGPTNISSELSGTGHTSVLYTSVDRNGFLLPAEEFWRQREAFRVTNRDVGKFGKDRQWVYAVGQMPETLRKAKKLAYEAVLESYYPRIPSWLGEKEFYNATILPEHRGVVLDYQYLTPPSVTGSVNHEEAGEGHHSSHANEPTRLELYDIDGNLVSSTESTYWCELFGRSLPNFDKGEVAFWDKAYLSDDRYYYLSDSVTGETVAVLDYDGTRLSTDSPPRRDPHKFTAFPKERILDLLQKQANHT